MGIKYEIKVETIAKLKIKKIKAGNVKPGYRDREEKSTTERIFFLPMSPSYFGLRWP